MLIIKLFPYISQGGRGAAQGGVQEVPQAAGQHQPPLSHLALRSAHTGRERSREVGNQNEQGCGKVPLFWNQVSFEEELY